MRSKKLILIDTKRKKVYSRPDYLLADHSVVYITYRVPVRFLGMVFTVEASQTAEVDHWFSGTYLNPVQVLRAGINKIEKRRKNNRILRRNEIKYNKQREQYARGLHNIQTDYEAEKANRQRESDRGEIKNPDK